MGQFYLCLVVACYCIALLFASSLVAVEGRVGLVGGFGSLDGRRPVPVLDVGDTEVVYGVVKEDGMEASSRSSRSSSSARGDLVGPELRSVPSGPDPMHHHGSPKMPDQTP